MRAKQMSSVDSGRADLPEVRASLEEHGYALLPSVDSVGCAVEVLSDIGEIIGQYDGHLTHEVTYRPGNDARSYSQSTNTIRAHTEAPGWQPSPAYLALFCHRQARCGGGHTELLDVYRILPRLTDAELALLTSRELDFPGPAHANGGAGHVRTPMLSMTTDGRQVLRFSYNLLTTGEYDPRLDARPDPARLPLGAEGASLAERVSELFTGQPVRVLIPENTVLIWDNRRMLHARSEYRDPARHLTRFWLGERSAA